MDKSKHTVERPQWLNDLLISSKKKTSSPKDPPFMVIIIESKLGNAILNVMRKYGLNVTAIEPDSEVCKMLKKTRHDVVLADRSTNQPWLLPELN